MKKHAWIITVMIIAIGIIGIAINYEPIKDISPLWGKIGYLLAWAGFWAVMFGLASVEEYPDKDKEM